MSLKKHKSFIKALIKTADGILCFLLQVTIRLYQYSLSPLIGKKCRFVPTCSEYAHQAFRQLGFFQAMKLSCIRIFRCHPFGAAGYDPVPHNPTTHKDSLTKKEKTYIKHS